jgi:hypothetical protein
LMRKEGPKRAPPPGPTEARHAHRQPHPSTTPVPQARRPVPSRAKNRQRTPSTRTAQNKPTALSFIFLANWLPGYLAFAFRIPTRNVPNCPRPKMSQFHQSFPPPRAGAERTHPPARQPPTSPPATAQTKPPPPSSIPD